MSICYIFPCVQGIQANQSFYICMIPCGLLPRLFPVEDKNILPEYRAQRKLNLKRIPDICDYILENRNTYVFSALAASVDGEFTFVSVKENVGVLQVPVDSSFMINDGQHRNAAIQEALKEDSTLRNETIPVVLFADKGLFRSQQMFTDLNKYAVKPSKSQNTFYDHKDSLAVLSSQIVKEVPFLRSYTDVENDTLGKFSAKLFTLNSFYTANQFILGKEKESKKGATFCQNYWKEIVNDIVEWQALINKEISKKSLREEYIVTQNIVLYALGKLGGHIYSKAIPDWKRKLKNLRKIDWLRTNDQWRNVAIEEGRIVIKAKNVSLTYLRIKQLSGFEMTEEEKKQLKGIEK